MPEKFKNFFSFFAKKKPLLLVFFFVILGIFCFAQSASAWWGEELANWIATRPFFFLFELLAKLMNWFAGLAGNLLNWVLSPKFTDLSYTDPAGNPVIDAGLSVTRGFVNMLLVLVLIYIAIATILRLAGYETKKLLVTFIIVALLVNFAPVICGLIVDASNIVMNFFVQDLKADAFGKTMGNHILTIKSGFSKTTEVEDAWGYIFRIAVISFMLSGLILFLLLFTILFILRYLVIWLLVILSPLAFVCYILPVTKKYFEMWWQQFLAWSFIGVTCGFFLYLSLLLASPQNMSRITKPIDTGGGGEPFFNSILPLIVPVIFLGIGFVFGLKTSAIGAGSVIGFAKTKGKMIVGKAPGVAYKGARIAAEGIAKGTARAAGKIRGAVLGEEGQKQWREWGEKQQTIAAKKRFNVFSRYGRRAAGALAGGRLAETQQAKIKKIEESKDIKDMERAPELLEAYNNSMTDTRRIAVLNKAIGKGKIGDLMDEKKYGKGALKEDEINRILGKARSWDADSTIKKAVPHLAAQYVTDDEFAEAQKKDPRITSKLGVIISKMKPEDYGNISEKALDIKTKKGVEVVDNMLLLAMGKHISQLIDKHGHIAAKVIEDRIDAGAPVSQRLESYLISQAGRGLISPKTKPSWKKPPAPTPPTSPSGPTPSAPSPPSGRRAGGGVGPSGGGTAPSGRRPGGRKYVESKVVENKPLKRPSLNP